jgi:hypothetical protein
VSSYKFQNFFVGIASKISSQPYSVVPQSGYFYAPKIAGGNSMSLDP